MRFTVLDSWRGVCALWVAIYHFRIVSDVHAIDLFRHGSLAVEFFFVLSGFVLMSAYGERLGSMADRARFMVRRFGRLYPLHLATLLVVIAMETARWAVSWKLGREVGGPVFAGVTDPAALVPNLLLIHGSGLLRDFTWNVPSWSISVEFLLCGLFVLAMSLPSRRITLPAFMLAGLSLYLFTRYGIEDRGESTTAMARGIYSFFLGVLVFRVYSAWRDAGRTAPGWMEWLVIPVFGVVSWLDHSPAPALLFAVMIFVFAFEGGPISRLMRWPPLVRLGEVSYSVYLVHYPMVLAAFGAAAIGGFVIERGGSPWMSLGSPLLGDLAVVVYSALVIAVSMLSFHWIERPGRDWFNALSRRI